MKNKPAARQRHTFAARACVSVLLCAAVLLSSGCTRTDPGAEESESSSPVTAPSVTEAPEEPGSVPVFSHQGGLYGEGFTLTLAVPGNAPDGAYITYTTNGKEPGPGSERYRDGISVTGTVSVRASLFSDQGERLGRIVTQTYVTDGAAGLLTVALTADPDDLYSRESGIMANRDGSGSEWERPVSVEIYGVNGEALIRQDAGIRLAGSGSRSFDPASFRLIARKPDKFDGAGLKYNGGGKFNADLFGDGFSSYDRLLLRNGGNDSPYQARENFLRMNLLRDCISNEYCAGLSLRTGVPVFAQRCVPVNVYLNGEYYGVSILKEDLDERLLSERFGLDRDRITVIKGKKLYYQLESGSQSELDEWLSLCGYAIDNALSDDFLQAYKYVSDRLDVRNAAAYLCVMLYLCNTDWPQNNAMVWRYTGKPGDGEYSDGKWRFAIRDMDLCFALHDAPSRVSNTTYTMADTDTFTRLLIFYRDGKGYSYDPSTGYYGDEMKLQGLFDFLLRSAEFRREFERISAVISSDAEAKHMTELTKKLSETASDGMKRHISTWKAAGKIFSGYTYKSWSSSFDGIYEFINERPKYFKKYESDAVKYYDGTR